jgi:tellurite methyltransferase
VRLLRSGSTRGGDRTLPLTLALWRPFPQRGGGARAGRVGYDAARPREGPGVTDQDRERWNRRYADRYQLRDYRWEPARWLLEIAERLRPQIPGLRALDLACGGGRNSVWLAERGWSVDAWDLSEVGLDILRRKLDEQAAARVPLDVTPHQVDLDDATLPPARYGLILNMLFLDRRLWPDMADGLTPGGLLAFETFVSGEPGSRPGVSPDHLLQPGELRAAFEGLGLQTLSYDEDADRATARLLSVRS